MKVCIEILQKVFLLPSEDWHDVVRQVDPGQLVRNPFAFREHFSCHERDAIVAQVKLKTIQRSLKILGYRLKSPHTRLRLVNKVKVVD